MGKGKFGTIIQIGDILVSEDVVMEYFACDYPVCRGACCIAGDSGAPLGEEELEPLERDYPAYCAHMTPEGRAAVDAKGFFEVDRDDDIVTPLMPSRDGSPDCPCAFCHFTPAGDCLCSIEMAGRTKPRSCSLYPVRVTKLTGGSLALNLHRWDICKPAYEKGAREHIRAYEFLKKPLSEAFGEDFYEALEAAAKHLLPGG
ncbi:MAG: DUF3109 family protein [Bacteroidales bacterium]|nr:DUF3109 family protein [Bacteroidales bacterium]